MCVVFIHAMYCQFAYWNAVFGSAQIHIRITDFRTRVCVRFMCCHIRNCFDVAMGAFDICFKVIAKIKFNSFFFQNKVFFFSSFNSIHMESQYPPIIRFLMEEKRKSPILHSCENRRRLSQKIRRRKHKRTLAPKHSALVCLMHQHKYDSNLNSHLTKWWQKNVLLLVRMTYETCAKILIKAQTKQLHEKFINKRILSPAFAFYCFW